MTDLISRQDAIALLERIETTDYPPESILSQCIEALTNMPSAESGWQPIETAPKDGTPVVILDQSSHYGDAPKGIGYLVAKFRKPRLGDWNYPNGKWEAMYGPCSASNPTHWMPLPEPPK